MKEDQPPSRKAGPRSGKTSPLTRQLSFSSRVRDSFRRATDRVLAADTGWSLALVLVTVAVLGSQRCGVSYEQLAVGEPATHDIRAKFDIRVPDEALIAERRREAREAVPDIYVYDTGRFQRLTEQLNGLFNEGRRLLEEPAPEATPDVSQRVAQAFGDRVEGGALTALVRQRFSPALERGLGEALGRGMRGLVIGNKALLEGQPEIIVAHVPGTREQPLSEYGSILDLDESREQVRAAVREIPGLPPADRRPLGGLAASFVDANLSFNPEATHARRDEAADTVAPVFVEVPRGKLLIRRGEMITPEVLAQLEAAQAASRGRLGLLDLVGLVLVVSMLAFFLYRYASYHQRRFKKIQHLHALLVLLQLSMLLLSVALLWVVGEVVDQFGSPFNQVQTYYYLVPLGAGSIMIALLANGRIAMVYSSFTALLFGAVAGWDAYLMTWGLIVQWAGIYGISTYRERAALIRAGLVVGGAGAVTALVLDTLRGPLPPLSGTLYGAGLAFVGGAVGVGLVISFTLPLLEGLFRVLTDVRLLELSNLNTPLLSELAVKAPGSYNHSLIVGTLAEEGAKAIGANSLFCRVAAFYHDIGKMLKPEYYVENQRGINPHDRLSPSMSALVIAAHVKDGIKLAREAGLAEQIVDIIPQHHGTRLMTYFYEKAKNSADPSLGPIEKDEFRYPGPKPQTREAAIFMLADAVEAAARTIDDPSPGRLKEMIRKVTNAIVLDRQLDECELTFMDLDRIQEAFLRFLVSMHHQRVDYPGFDFGKPKGEPKSAAETAERRVARGR